MAANCYLVKVPINDSVLDMDHIRNTAFVKKLGPAAKLILVDRTLLMFLRMPQRLTTVRTTITQRIVSGLGLQARVVQLTEDEFAAEQTAAESESPATAPSSSSASGMPVVNRGRLHVVMDLLPQLTRGERNNVLVKLATLYEPVSGVETP